MFHNSKFGSLWPLSGIETRYMCLQLVAQSLYLLRYPDSQLFFRLRLILWHRTMPKQKVVGKTRVSWW